MNRREARGGPGAIGMAAGLVVAIFGPTASGKTAVAEAIADRVAAELVSADSMQVYEGLPILTNQPSRPTHLVGVWPLDHEGSVAEYASLAHAAIDGIAARGRLPVVVGGTGLYLRAALAELAVPPAPLPGSRARLEAFYDDVGADVAYLELAKHDPEAARRVHPNDRRRVVRALELTEVGATLAPREDSLWTSETRRPTLIVGLEVDPGVLEQRIEERTKLMLERGAAAEARRAAACPLSRTARQVIGLRELTDLAPDDAARAIVVRTRQYAAYQRKWMKRIARLHRLNGDRSPADTAETILTLAGNRERPPGEPVLTGEDLE